MIADKNFIFNDYFEFDFHLIDLCEPIVWLCNSTTPSIINRQTTQNLF